MSDDIKGVRALVTGAGAGIGHAVCLALAGSGAAVTAVARDLANLQQLARDLGPGPHHCWSIDLATAEGAAELAGKLAETGMPLIVVNNLHVTSPKVRLRNMDAAAFGADFTANLDHLFSIIDPVLAAQHAAQYGRWIGITSQAARAGMPGQARYNAQKAAMEAMMRTLAVEEGNKGVTANCVSPGFIGTPSVNARLPMELREQLTRANAAGRAGKPEHVAQAVLFLASPSASYVTGEVLCVDGGASLAWAFK